MFLFFLAHPKSQSLELNYTTLLWLSLLRSKVGSKSQHQSISERLYPEPYSLEFTRSSLPVFSRPNGLQMSRWQVRLSDHWQDESPVPSSLGFSCTLPLLSLPLSCTLYSVHQPLLLFWTCLRFSFFLSDISQGFNTFCFCSGKM